MGFAPAVSSTISRASTSAVHFTPGGYVFADRTPDAFKNVVILKWSSFRFKTNGPSK